VNWQKVASISADRCPCNPSQQRLQSSVAGAGQSTLIRRTRRQANNAQRPQPASASQSFRVTLQRTGTCPLKSAHSHKSYVQK